MLYPPRISSTFSRLTYGAWQEAYLVSQASQFRQYPAAKGHGFHGQTYSLLIGEHKPFPFELILENTVLFYKITDGCLLLAVKPAH